MAALFRKCVKDKHTYAGRQRVEKTQQHCIHTWNVYIYLHRMSYLFFWCRSMATTAGKLTHSQKQTAHREREREHLYKPLNPDGQLSNQCQQQKHVSIRSDFLLANISYLDSSMWSVTVGLPDDLVSQGRVFLTENSKVSTDGIGSTPP